ncbi:peptide-methionine (S)-S-oxide reductase MsrA [Treponema sp.]
MNSTHKIESAVIGGGCFWCIEAVYKRIEGIVSSKPGYAGGNRDNPDYQQVSSGLTGHAEVVKLEFDPEKISYEAVLDIFFSAHDPTTEDRQGADVGTQYRSIILYSTEEQRAIAERKITEINGSGAHDSRLVTELVPLDTFWPAEEYHQNYYETHPYAGYCRVVIAPKLKKIGLDTLAINV